LALDTAGAFDDDAVARTPQTGGRRSSMTRRIFFDGLNLALERGTGIATYTRMLTALAHEGGDEVGLVYASPRRPLRDKRLRNLDFIGPRRPGRWVSKMHGRWNDVVDQVECVTGLHPRPVEIPAAAEESLSVPTHEHLYVARNLFGRAARYFAWRGRFAELDFAVRPDILHCTYPMPIAAKGARNVYTIHDLIPLRLPHTTLDSKRHLYRLLNRIAATADHIVTVSEHSRRDIIEMLGADEARVTNTYEAVEFPPEMLERPDDIVAGDLMSRYRLEAKTYLLFYGAIEPKKNVKALLEAYRQTGTKTPLVMVGGGGWSNEAETRMLKAIEAEEAVLAPEKRRVRRLDYADRSTLVSLIKGAQAVLFPSLYEGFGLPVLEGMMLGTPVVTSKSSSLPEIGGDAALYVDPNDVGDIARAIRTIAADADLRAELARRGRKQAELFSMARYRERISAVYDRLA
jgi:glycosyltransferase involved in cell wall biosynthesis